MSDDEQVESGDVHRVEVGGREILLIGTAHVSQRSVDLVREVIEREKPDALLPTMGGQTALNIAMELDQQGVLEKHGVELIGANARSIRMAEDREEFAAAMARIGLELPHGGFARTLDEALIIIEETGYPAIIRPSFTLGGTGAGIAYNADEFTAAVTRGLDTSPITEVLIDRSVIGLSRSGVRHHLPQLREEVPGVWISVPNHWLLL